MEVNSDLLFFKQLLIGGDGIRETSGFDCTHIEQFSLDVSKRMSYGSKSTEQVRMGAFVLGGGVFNTPSSRHTLAMYSGWTGVWGMRSQTAWVMT